MMENYTMFYVFIMNIVQFYKYLLSTSYGPGRKNANMREADSYWNKKGWTGKNIYILPKITAYSDLGVNIF